MSRPKLKATLAYYALHHVEGFGRALPMVERTDGDGHNRHGRAEAPMLDVARIGAAIKRAGITPREHTALLVYHAFKHRKKVKALCVVLGCSRAHAYRRLGDIEERVLPYLQAEGMA